MDIVVGTLGGLAKLFDQGYLRRNRVAEVGIDEVDTMLDDTFRYKKFDHELLPGFHSFHWNFRDETLSFLQQFGRSGAGRAMISGVIINIEKY